MATNYVQKGEVINLPVPAGKLSGAHVLVGKIPAVCLTDRDVSGYSECALTGVFSLSVTGAGPSGSAAVTLGAKIYDDSGVLNVDSTNGTEFGVALEAVASGATGTIKVRLKG